MSKLPKQTDVLVLETTNNTSDFSDLLHETHLDVVTKSHLFSHVSKQKIIIVAGLSLIVASYFFWADFKIAKKEFLEGTPMVKTAATITSELRTVYDLKDPKPYVWVVTNPSKLSAVNIPLLSSAQPGDKIFMFNEKAQSGNDVPNVVVLYRTSQQKILGSVKLNQNLYNQVKSGT